MRHLRELACALVVLVGVGGCGRVGFAPAVRGDGGDGDGGDGGDGGPQAPAMLVAPSDPAGMDLKDVAFDPGGLLALTGTFHGAVTLGPLSATSLAGPNGADAYVAVVDRDGTAQWLFSAGSNLFADGENVAWRPDGDLEWAGYFGGALAYAGAVDSGSGQDAAIAVFSVAGVLRRLAHYGGFANVQARGLDVNPTSVLAGGIYGDTVDFGDGPLPSVGSLDNGWISQTRLATSVVKSRALTGPSDVFVNDVALSANGDVCVGGRFKASADFGGGPVASANSSAFVAKYDSALALRWVRAIGDVAQVNAIAFTEDGDCVAAGNAVGPFVVDGLMDPAGGGTDGWVIRFAATNGAARWLRTIAGAGDDSVYAVATYPPDRIAIAGRFAGAATVIGMATTSEGGSDGFVIGLDGAGTRIWSQLLTGAGDVNLSLSGMAIDLPRRRLAVAIGGSGELRIGEVVVPALAAAAVILPIPP